MSIQRTEEAATSQMLVVEHVFKTVPAASGELEILHDIDFALAAGSTTAIVGASGSGKSTLLSIMAGLDVPSSGTVRVAGTDLFALDEDARAAVRGQKMGFVFQNFQLLPNLTALENVMLPLELAGRSDARASAQAMLEQVGLGARLRHYPKVLSGGEQQRVALARAFVMQPAVLLADEPTGSLDFATGQEVIAQMFALNQALGSTLVLVTHDIALARQCQRQLTLQAGRLVQG
ncbi:MAG: ATP-binding cassette domain-containing protein [Brachymonas sp.]|nr:ATP-binding cassette domain-containing protein [Brachymonas sp.]